jgi:hypothetical protein
MMVLLIYKLAEKQQFLQQCDMAAGIMEPEETGLLLGNVSINMYCGNGYVRDNRGAV